MATTDIDRIESRIDRAAAGAIAVSDNVGGIMFQSMSEVLEFSKLMSVSDVAVPKHLRGNPGACLSIVTQALEWRMSPFSVANKSYSVNDRLAYESQLIHGVVEARAPLKQRLRCSYEGEGDKLVCIVTGHFKDEVEPVIYKSPEFAKITPKNSPLWKSDPQQQLWYYSVRAFARRYCPDVLLGIYSEDELKDAGGTADGAVDITPKPSVGKRLSGGKNRRGFSEAHVNEQTGGAEPVPVVEATIDGEETPRQRGDRLLAGLTTAEDISALQESISDELAEDQRVDWVKACAARQDAVKVSKAA